jgi:hypothetical protein
MLTDILDSVLTLFIVECLNFGRILFLIVSVPDFWFNASLILTVLIICANKYVDKYFDRYQYQGSLCQASHLNLCSSWPVSDSTCLVLLPFWLTSFQKMIFLFLKSDSKQNRFNSSLFSSFSLLIVFFQWDLCGLFYKYVLIVKWQSSWVVPVL